VRLVHTTGVPTVTVTMAGSRPEVVMVTGWVAANAEDTSVDSPWTGRGGNVETVVDERLALIASVGADASVAGAGTPRTSERLVKSETSLKSCLDFMLCSSRRF
jgi:hypothetical protein